MTSTAYIVYDHRYIMWIVILQILILMTDINTSVPRCALGNLWIR